MAEERLDHSEWKGTTGGTPWMQRFMVKTFRHMPLFIPYWCMGWVILFYMLFNHQEYLWTYRYFRKRRGFSRLKSFIWVYVNHFRFGQVVVDRFAMYSGKHFELHVEGQELFDELEAGESGFIQVGSHVGNYELAGYTLVAKHKTFNALVFSGETEEVASGRNRMFADKNIKVVPVSPDLSHIFTLNSALADGNIVSIPGDRIFGSPKYLVCDFMGSKARFPLGPYAMAVQRDVPMLAVFVMKESTKRYNVYVRRLELPADKPLKRNEKMAALAQTFATEMEKILDTYPSQWYNYFDFWKDHD